MASNETTYLLSNLVEERADLQLQSLRGAVESLYLTKAISSAFLANFPIAMNTPDLVDLLRNEWTDVFKSMKRNEKKDAEVLRNSFKNLFLKSVYPLMYSYALPKFALNDQESQSERWRLMKELSADMKKTPLCLLTSSSIQHKPFLLRETTVDVINPFYASSTYTSSSPMTTTTF